MNQAREDLLVLAAQGGNEQAFELLVRRYQQPLLHFAFKLCGDRQAAQDAVQESWIKIARTLHRLKDPRAFKSWIFRAVRWRVIDCMRRLPTREVTLEEAAGPTQGIELDDSAIYLRQLMAQLPELDRQALHLFYLEDMKVQEIAAVLEIPAGTVKSRLNRARKRFRQALQGSSDSTFLHQQRVTT